MPDVVLILTEAEARGLRDGVRARLQLKPAEDFRASELRALGKLEAALERVAKEHDKPKRQPLGTARGGPRRLGAR